MDLAFWGLATRTLPLAMKKQLALWLAHYLRTQQKSQAWLAEKLGLSEAQVSRLLSGGRGFGPYAIVAMREKLHMDLNVCIDGAPPEAPAAGPPIQRPATRRAGASR